MTDTSPGSLLGRVAYVPASTPPSRRSNRLASTTGFAHHTGSERHLRSGQWRLTEATFTRLVASAQAHGVSFSEEVRRRVEASFAAQSGDVLDAVKLVQQFVVDKMTAEVVQ